MKSNKTISAILIIMLCFGMLTACQNTINDNQQNTSIQNSDISPVHFFIYGDKAETLIPSYSIDIDKDGSTDTISLGHNKTGQMILEVNKQTITLAQNLGYDPSGPSVENGGILITPPSIRIIHPMGRERTFIAITTVIDANVFVSKSDLWIVEYSANKFGKVIKLPNDNPSIVSNYVNEMVYFEIPKDKIKGSFKIEKELIINSNKIPDEQKAKNLPEFIDGTDKLALSDVLTTSMSDMDMDGSEELLTDRFIYLKEYGIPLQKLYRVEKLTADGWNPVKVFTWSEQADIVGEIILQQIAEKGKLHINEIPELISTMMPNETTNELIEKVLSQMVEQKILRLKGNQYIFDI